MQTIHDCVQCGGECDPAKHMFLPSKEAPTDSSPDSSPSAKSRKTRFANNTASPTHTIASGDSSSDAVVHAGPSGPLFEGQIQGAGSSRGPPSSTPVPTGLFSPGRVGAAANLSTLRQEELRLEAAIKEQERLENVRRAEDEAALRREI